MFVGKEGKLIVRATDQGNVTGCSLMSTDVAQDPSCKPSQTMSSAQGRMIQCLWRVPLLNAAQPVEILAALPAPFLGARR